MLKFKLTPEEIELFKGLQSSTTIGRSIEKMLSHFCDYLCDVRNMADLDTETMKGHAIAATAIQREIIRRIQMRNDDGADTELSEVGESE